MKSSLLQAILGELPLASGSVEARGRVAYTSQDPWVFGGTMRDNVLFGEDYKEEWYNMVTEACCLSEDIDKLLYGDMTLVGERGVSLSGGQRARVNLARSAHLVHMCPSLCTHVPFHVYRHVLMYLDMYCIPKVLPYTCTELK